MIDFFVRHRTAANLLMAAILVLGVLGYFGLRRQLLPDFNPSYITVSIDYPGASASRIEESVARPVYQSVNGIGGIRESIATSQDERFELQLELANGHDKQLVLDDVRSALESDVDLPDDTEEPVIALLEPDESVVDISVVGPLSERQLHQLATNLQEDVRELEGVKDVDLRETPDPTIKIELDRMKLVALSLTVQDVAQQISSHSLDLPTGSIETNERVLQLRLVDQSKTVEEFEQLPILTNRQGMEVPLKAVAQISEEFTSEQAGSRFNGKPAISMTVIKSDQGDLIRTAERVKALVEARQSELPSGVELHVWNDRSSMVRQRLSMVSRNLMQGVVLVFLTLWVFLQLRLAFWIAVGIAVSFAGGFFVMYVFDLTLDMFSLFSLILALGLIVDDAIVIGENIHAQRQSNEDKKVAAINATKEVAVGVVSSMFTTCAILLPLMMLRGELGQIVRVIPIVVVATLGVSLVEAFLILPNHLSHTLKGADSPAQPIRATFEFAIESFIQRVYRPILRFSVHNTGFVSAVAIAMLLITGGLLSSGRVETILMESIDSEVVVARVILPDGTDSNRTREIVERLEGAIRPPGDQVGRGSLTTNVSHSPEPDYSHDSLVLSVASDLGSHAGARERGGHVATVMAQLVESDKRDITSGEVADYWRKQFGNDSDLVQVTFESSWVEIGGKSLEFRLQGDDYQTLKRASLLLQEKLREFPGVNNIVDDLRPGKQEVQIRLKPAARALGITTLELGTQLRDAFWGSEVQRFQRGRDSFVVEVVLDDPSRESLGDLDRFHFQTADGREIPFHTIAEAKLTRGYSKLTQLDGRPTVTVGADLDYAQANPHFIAANLDRQFWPELKKEYPEVRPMLSGQIKEGNDNQSEMYAGFAIGLMIMYVCLSYVFSSFVEPIIVMAAIPFGLIGAIVGHFVLGLAWQDTSLFGFMILSGIVVNDSIVLIRFIKSRIQEGMPIQQAIEEAGCRRFRAVVLTSLTTAMGLLPILLEQSFQARLIMPLAVSISFGILFATGLILLLIPSLYGCYQRLVCANQTQSAQ